MASYEQTIIIGNVGSDPEWRMLPSGTPISTFSVAVTTKWKDRQTQEQRENTTWYRVSCWNGLADVAKNFIKKGKQVMIVGKVTASAYLGQDGQPRATLELRADNLQMLGTRADNDEMGGESFSSAGQSGGRSKDYNDQAPSATDEIPF